MTTSNQRYVDVAFAEMLSVMQERLRDTLNRTKTSPCIDVECSFLRLSGQTGHSPKNDIPTLTRLFFAPLDFKEIHPDVLIAAWADFMIDATNADTDTDTLTQKRIDIMTNVLRQVVNVWWDKEGDENQTPPRVTLNEVLDNRKKHDTLHSLLHSSTSSG